MAVPRNTVLIAFFLIILSITSGKRGIDYFVMSNQGGADVMVGSAVMPIILFPATLVLSFIALSKLPKTGSERIPLFYWGRGNTVRQVLWSALYGVIFMVSLTWTINWSELFVEFMIAGDATLAIKSGLYLTSSLGANYAWLCFRSLTCYPRNVINEA